MIIYHVYKPWRVGIHALNAEFQILYSILIKTSIIIFSPLIYIKLDLNDMHTSADSLQFYSPGKFVNYICVTVNDPLKTFAIAAIQSALIYT